MCEEDGADGSTRAPRGRISDPRGDDIKGAIRSALADGGDEGRGAIDDDEGELIHLRA